MTIIVTGGGSGGHITPILAVAAELKSRQPEVKIIFIGQSGDSLVDIPANDPNIAECHTIQAGKFRRYHGDGWRQILDFRTQYLNIRDSFRTIQGLIKSWWLLGKIKPDVIFTRGGFVSVPVALAAAIRRIPYLTHDSDSTPSLANRIIKRWAAQHLVALPADNYSYKPFKTVVVGIPINNEYKPVNEQQMAEYRRQIGINNHNQVVCVTGGGNGAHKLNQLILDNASYLLNRYPKLVIINIAGRGLLTPLELQYKNLISPKDYHRLILKDFVSDLYRYTGAADVIIARGGATNLAEFAQQGKACIIIPSPQLGWNIANTQVLADQGAVVYLSEEQAEQERRLGSMISDLLDNPSKRLVLTKKIAQFAVPDAAKRIAELIIIQVRKSGGG